MMTFECSPTMFVGVIYTNGGFRTKKIEIKNINKYNQMIP